MNILITGSNGFVGSRLMYYLEDKRHRVWGIDNSEECNIENHPKTKIGDIRNIEDLRKFDDMKFDVIIHCAADKHDFGISKESYFSNNEYGTQIVTEYAIERGINKIIYYSTVSVYGHQDHPCDETADYLSNTVYGDSKFAGEKILWKWQKADAERALITLCPSVIYGPNNFANMYNLINQMHKFPWLMVGNGSHIKSMIALENMVDMTFFMLDKFKPGVQNFNCIDKPYLTVKQLMKTIANNDGFSMPKIYISLWFAISIGKIFDLLGKLIGKELPINSDRMKKFGTSTDYRAEKIRELGYVQQHSIEDVFKQTCEWYLKVNTK
ncbi:MAG: NAD(P)-dependent oxidoreductase [Candidatus Cloacimonetes bacterium]|jgi:nucleoside-diphosphate-sugar epimerase|nr:NAD(P)-dependent oxidoreductase [Candidatus Cloacimonadota bacterium]